VMLVKRIVLIVFCCLLVSCSSYAPLPTDHYYRLAEIKTGNVVPKHITGSILVQQFIADGLHHERPLLYTSDTSSLELKQYHYHLWLDSPTRMLQEQLADYLRIHQAADTIFTGYEGPAEMIIRGQIKQFERQADKVVVRLVLRIDKNDSSVPLFQQDYQRVI